MKTTIRLRLVNANQIIAKIDGNAMLGAPWKAAMEQAAKIGEEAVRRRTPVLTGKLEASVTSHVDTRPVPRWAIITAEADNKGFRYPFALDVGKAKRHTGTVYQYHYASFRTSTRHWFTGALGKVKAGIDGILNDAAHAIEARWNR